MTCVRHRCWKLASAAGVLVAGFATTTAAADERVRQRVVIDRSITFQGAGCGVVVEKTLGLARKAREVSVTSPLAGAALTDDDFDDVVGRISEVTIERKHDRPSVTVSFQSSDAACDPANPASAGWIASTEVIGRYVTLERVYVTGTGRGDRRRYKPRVLLFGMRSALVDLRWQRWGSRRAVGRGKVEYNSCIPNCAEAPPSYYPVRATLTRRRTCGDYVQYRVLRFRYTSSRRPPGLPRTYRETFPCR
jgi:hypothetical protein